MPKKFYVVWVGRETGVFTDWPHTKIQVDEFPQARYKSFPRRAEAEAAYAAGSNVPDQNIPHKKGPRAINPLPKTSTSEQPFDVEIYCDGASEPNPGKAGSGLAIYRKGILSELWYGLYDPKGTNNTAELNALHQALLAAKKNSVQGLRVQIFCDSQYAIHCITVWAYAWKKVGWKRKTGEIKNLAIIQETHALYETLKNKVVVSHVKAHVGIEGNELADRMTVFAINQKNPNFCQYSDALNIPKILNFRAG